MLIYFSPSISLSSDRQNKYILSFSMFVNKLMRPFTPVTFQMFKRELSGNVPHLVSGCKSQGIGSKEVPNPMMSLEAQNSKYNLRNEGTEYHNFMLPWGHA